MRLERPRLELGMELHGDEPRMAGQLGDLDELAVRRSARDAHALLAQRRLVEAVELEAMAMALGDESRRRTSVRERSGHEVALVAAQAHRAAELVDAEQIAQLVDHAVRRGLVDFGRVGAFEQAHVAREFDGRPLEAVADAEVGHLCARAYSAAFIMPRVPREPKPPGTRMPCDPSSRRRPPSCSSASASTHWMLIRRRLAKPPW